MKRLIITFFIIAGLIGVGIIVSVSINRHYNNELQTANKQGLEEGRTQGYESGFKDGHKNGFQEGSLTGYRVDNNEYPSNNNGSYFTYNPTFDEVIAILAECDRFTANEVNDYAETNGIRTAYIRCQIARKTDERTVFIYNLVAFDTIDQGFIIFRPRTHEKVKIEIGESYSALNNFPTPSYDDTITNIIVVW
ncbi:MAG: hypothetical protein PHQ86_01135 [Dehalococcoidales bacterium]|nr:hypothetical protein [Dehalococcoidales bacterium]